MEKKIQKVIIRTLENLDDFNPTKTSETKTAGTNLTISIPIKIK